MSREKSETKKEAFSEKVYLLEELTKKVFIDTTEDGERLKQHR